MVRQLSTSLQTKSSQLTGAEPLVFIVIYWTDTLAKAYAGKKFVTGSFGQAQDRLLDLSPISQRVVTDGESTISAITVTLSDNDLSLRAQMDSTPIDNVKAEVYMTFSGADSSTKLAGGRVSSPIVWQESSRTLRFDVVSAPFSKSVGKTLNAEDDDVNADAEGRSIPVPFGHVVDVPAVKIRRSPVAILAEAITTTDPLTAKIRVDSDDPLPVGELTQYLIGREVVLARANANETLTIIQRNLVRYQVGLAPRPIGDPDENNPYVIYTGQTATDLVGYHVSVASPGTLNFEHDNFVIGQLGGKLWCARPFFQLFESVLMRARAFREDQLPIIDSSGAITGSQTVGWALQAGEEVRLYEDGEDIYAFADRPSSEINIKEVKAYRDIPISSDQSVTREELVCVPEEYYEVIADTIGTNEQSIPLIKFPIPLSQLNSSWKDEELFITVEAGSRNTSDQIKYIVENYTDLSVDSSSFTDVAFRINDYPSDFAIQNSPDALRTISDIAWQARCALINKGDIVSLKYLSEEPQETDGSIGDPTRLETSIEEESTSIVDLVTVFNATWQSRYSEDERTLTFTNNVNRFGRLERDFKFWIYQLKKNVQKSAQFWSRRKSRTWREIRATGFMELIKNDVLDVISVSSPELFSFPTTNGFIQEINFLTTPFNVQVRVWLPIETGTIVKSSAAYDTDHPSDGSQVDQTANVNPCEVEVSFRGRLPQVSFNLSGGGGPSSNSSPALIENTIGLPPGKFNARLYPNGFTEPPGEAIVAEDIQGGSSSVNPNDPIIVTQSPAGGYFFDSSVETLDDTTSNLASEVNSLQAQINALNLTKTFIATVLNHISGPTYNVEYVFSNPLNATPNTSTINATAIGVHPDDETDIQPGTPITLILYGSGTGTQAVFIPMMWML